MNVIPIYRPYVFLRCRKCGRKTDHVLINSNVTRKGEVEETYECQECGETKKIYELSSMMGSENLGVQELEEKIEAKRAVVEQLESKKRELEKRLKELERKDHMEPTENEALDADQQPVQTEEQPKRKRAKKKRRFF